MRCSLVAVVKNHTVVTYCEIAGREREGEEGGESIDAKKRLSGQGWTE